MVPRGIGFSSQKIMVEKNTKMYNKNTLTAMVILIILTTNNINSDG